MVILITLLIFSLNRDYFYLGYAFIFKILILVIYFLFAVLALKKRSK